MLLSDFVDTYATSLEGSELAKGTQRNIKRVAREFLAHVGNIQTHNVTRAHVDSYFAVRKVSCSPNTLNVELSSLRHMWRYAMLSRAAKVDVFDHRRQFKFVKQERRRVPVHEFPRLMDAAAHPRDRMFIALGLYSMLRQGEILDLRVQDVDLDGRWLTVRIFKTFQNDRMPIPRELDRELRRWLTFYSEECGPLQPHWHLVPAKTASLVRGRLPGGEPIPGLPPKLQPTKRVYNTEKIVQHALQGCGYETRNADGTPMMEGGHTLRRSAALALYQRLAKEGHDNALMAVSAVLHHASVKTTEHYLGMTHHRRMRDEILRGQDMFPVDTTNVIELPRKEAVQ